MMVVVPRDFCGAGDGNCGDSCGGGERNEAKIDEEHDRRFTTLSCGNLLGAAMG